MPSSPSFPPAPAANNSNPYFRNVSLTIDDSPRDTDVLCGSKSKAVAAHPGNELLRQKIESCIAAYNATQSLQERITLNRSIVTFMRQQYGTRFLKRAAAPAGGNEKAGGWMLAEDQAIRDKISHALRFAAQQKKRQAAAAAAATTTTTSSSRNGVAARPVVPSAFARQQEILQGIMRPGKDTAVAPIITNVPFSSTSTLPPPVEVSESSLLEDQTPAPIVAADEDDDIVPLDIDYNNSGSMPIIMMDGNHNNANDEPMEITATSEQQQTNNNAAPEQRRESTVLPNMAAQVSANMSGPNNNLNYQDATPEHHRASAVKFASVLSTLWS